MANFHGFEPSTPFGMLFLGRPLPLYIYPLYTLAFGSIFTLKTPFYGLWEPQEGPKLASKWQIFMVLNPFKVLLETFRGHIKVF